MQSQRSVQEIIKVLNQVSNFKLEGIFALNARNPKTAVNKSLNTDYLSVHRYDATLYKALTLDSINGLVLIANESPRPTTAPMSKLKTILQNPKYILIITISVSQISNEFFTFCLDGPQYQLDFSAFLPRLLFHCEILSKTIRLHDGICAKKSTYLYHSHRCVPLRANVLLRSECNWTRYLVYKTQIAGLKSAALLLKCCVEVHLLRP